MIAFDTKAVTVICFNSGMSVIGYSIMDYFVTAYVTQRINTPLLKCGFERCPPLGLILFPYNV